jgi:hypothetical protein
MGEPYTGYTHRLLLHLAFEWVLPANCRPDLHRGRPIGRPIGSCRLPECCCYCHTHLLLPTSVVLDLLKTPVLGPIPRVYFSWRETQQQRLSILPHCKAGGSNMNLPLNPLFCVPAGSSKLLTGSRLSISVSDTPIFLLENGSGCRGRVTVGEWNWPGDSGPEAEEEQQVIAAACNLGEGDPCAMCIASSCLRGISESVFGPALALCALSAGAAATVSGASPLFSALRCTVCCARGSRPGPPKPPMSSTSCSEPLAPDPSAGVSDI